MEQVCPSNLESTPMTTLVLLEKTDHIALITMNRPESRNALSLALLHDLKDTLSTLANDRDVRCLILTGTGDKAFSAGADLKERLPLKAEERSAHSRLINQVASDLERFPVPVIAAIRGFALAGGAELAVACDLRVMSDDGMIGLPEVRIGVFPGAGGVIRLPRLIGPGRARDLLFTGRRVGADEALSIGLIDRIAPNQDVLNVAMDLAQEIAAGAPLAIRALKTALIESSGLSSGEAERIVAPLRVSLDGTRDYDEGLRAFSERRAPQFTGE